MKLDNSDILFFLVTTKILSNQNFKTASDAGSSITPINCFTFPLYRLAYLAVMTMRTGFDLGSGYTIGRKWGTLDERSVLIRCIFLETVAGNVELNAFFLLM